MHRIALLMVILSLLGGPAVNGICSTGPLDDWTQRHSEGSGAFGDVAYGGGIFVAIGHSPVGTIYRSPDGVTWDRVHSITGAYASGVVVGDGGIAISGGTRDGRSAAAVWIGPRLDPEAPPPEPPMPEN